MPPAGRVSFNSDWEGPWVTADHAHDVIAKGIPNGSDIYSNSSGYIITHLNGSDLFSRISEFDDHEYYVEKREGYETGDTLALVAPYILAFGLGSEFVRRIAREDANFIPGARETLGLMRASGWRPKIISTSYEQYVHLTAGELAGIPVCDLYCTRFPIDDYSAEITEEDKRMVREKAVEIAKLPRLNVTDSTRPGDLSSQDLATIRFLDRFYWDTLPRTSFARLVREIKPVGGRRKYEAVLKSLEVDGRRLSESVTVGDSITDEYMLGRANEAGGLAISFNGNGYAVRKANVAVMSPDCTVTAVLADVFARGGLQAVEGLAKSWNVHDLHWLVERELLSREFYDAFKEAFSAPDVPFPVVRWLDGGNVEAAIIESKEWRKRVRGRGVGSLG